MRILYVSASLLLTSTAFAVESDPGNIFHADLSNPDLALAVSAFEETCMPFVLHKTKLTQKMDGQHMAKLMESRKFEFQSSDTRSRRVIVEPSKVSWQPKSQAINWTIHSL